MSTSARGFHAHGLQLSDGGRDLIGIARADRDIRAFPASVAAIARPMPRVPPSTTAFFPSNPNPFCCFPYVIPGIVAGMTGGWCDESSNRPTPLSSLREPTGLRIRAPVGLRNDDVEAATATTWCDGQISPKVCPALRAKIFRFRRRANQCFNSRHPVPRGAGGPFVTSLGREAVDAARRRRRRMKRTAKACGPGARSWRQVLEKQASQG